MSRFNKVAIVRNNQRLGLIKSRLLGIKHSTGPVLTFLDSHCECADGWLEPLLSRINVDSTIVPCPIIDNIDTSTLEYVNTGQALNWVGGFTWELMFIWVGISVRERKKHKHKWEPFQTPTMAGIYLLELAWNEILNG